MPHYVILSNLTAKGLADLKSGPARYQAVVKGIEAAGGKVLSFHATMGAYDYVMVAEAPSEFPVPKYGPHDLEPSSNPAIWQPHTLVRGE